MSRTSTHIALIVAATAALPVSAAELEFSVEPVRVEFAESDFVPGVDEREGWQVTGVWELSKTLDIRVAWHDARTPLRSVVSSPYWNEYATRGYSVAFSEQDFGPFELYGRVDVLDVDVGTPSNLKLAIGESRRVTIAGASARWRPTNEHWGFEAGANRATGRPTFVGVGVFISF